MLDTLGLGSHTHTGVPIECKLPCLRETLPSTKVSANCTFRETPKEVKKGFSVSLSFPLFKTIHPPLNGLIDSGSEATIDTI